MQSVLFFTVQGSAPNPAKGILPLETQVLFDISPFNLRILPLETLVLFDIGSFHVRAGVRPKERAVVRVKVQHVANSIRFGSREIND